MAKMPWGKFAGVDLTHVPASYLVHIVEHYDGTTDRDLLREIKREISTRLDLPHKIKYVEIVKSGTFDEKLLEDWLRKASLAAHPDTGGSLAMMKLVNELRRIVRGSPTT